MWVSDEKAVAYDRGSRHCSHVVVVHGLLVLLRGKVQERHFPGAGGWLLARGDAGSRDTLRLNVIDDEINAYHEDEVEEDTQWRNTARQKTRSVLSRDQATKAGAV